MALDTNLRQFLGKASGVYRLLIDKSQIPATTAGNTLPLVVGFSKTGVFNTPVFCPTPEFFISIFGNIDRTLEKKGSFFHRSAIELLSVSPIIALNLFDINQAVPEGPVSTWDIKDPLFDLTEWKSISTAVGLSNGPKRLAPLSSFYNTDTFWTPSTENFIATAGSNKQMINIVNLSQKNISVIILKSTLTGYDVTAREWYGDTEEGIPDFIAQNDWMSDYMVDVHIFEGDYSDYQKLSTDPILGQYFDPQRGFIASKIGNFLAQPEVKRIGFYQGSLIPDFQDKQGRNLFIETIVNSNVATHGLYMAVNTGAFDNFVSGKNQGVDIIGHNFEAMSRYNENAIQRINYLSYKENLLSIVSSGERLQNVQSLTLARSSSSGFTWIYETYELVIAKSVISSEQQNYLLNIVPFKSFVSVQPGSPSHNQIISVTESSTHIIIKFASDWGITFNNVISYVFTIKNNLYSSFDINENALTTIATQLRVGKLNPIGQKIESGELKTGDWIVIGGNKLYIKIEPASDYNLLPLSDNALTPTASDRVSYNLKLFRNPQLQNPNNTYTYQDLFTISKNLEGQTGNDFGTQVLFIHSYNSNFNQMIPINVALNALRPNTNQIWVPQNTNITIGSFIVSDFGTSTTDSRLTRVTSVQEENVVDPSTGLTISVKRITADDDIAIDEDGYIEKYSPIYQWAEYLDFHSLYGYRVKDRYSPDGSQDRINDIYNVLYKTNLAKGLKQKNLIPFRYIVDSMTGVIGSSTKSQLSRLARARENAFAICNLPSTKQFKESVNPRFTDIPTAQKPNPAVRGSYIATGGNLQLNPTRLFTLPSIEEGAAFSAFFGPHLVCRERGREFLVPPAAYFAKNFILKHFNGNPWDILAGTRRGVLTGSNIVGVENQWDDDDRGPLEAWGYNPIILERGVGLTVTNNATAQRKIRSALSEIHNVEAIITLQDRIAEKLKSYVWEYNIAQNRLEMKQLSDAECEIVKTENGIADYRNVVNTNNNNRDVIENNLGVVDTYIEMNFGMGIIVNRTTVLRNGTIESGFIEGV